MSQNSQNIVHIRNWYNSESNSQISEYDINRFLNWKFSRTCACRVPAGKPVVHSSSCKVLVTSSGIQNPARANDNRCASYGITLNFRAGKGNSRRGSPICGHPQGSSNTHASQSSSATSSVTTENRGDWSCCVATKRCICETAKVS